MMQSIPVNIPLINPQAKLYLNQCVDDGWISSEGSFVQTFEEKFSASIQKQVGISVANGTAALEIVFRALNLKPGDEVILPTFCIISCAQAIVLSHLKPVLVDCDPDTFNMDLRLIEKKITDRTRAILAVHTYGLPVDLAPLISLCKQYNLLLIEDGAEAIGLNYQGKPCGSFGYASVFSFYANKLVTTGEGGMIVTDDLVFAERCRYLRNLCFQSERRFVHEEIGWNYRLSNLQAALGVAQFEWLDKFIEKKQHIGYLYNELLADVDGIQLPAIPDENMYWVYPILLKQKTKDAAYVMQKLAERGIGTRPFFYPIHQQPVFKKMGLFHNESYPVSEYIAKQGFYIPSGLGTTDEQIRTVAVGLKETLGSLCYV